MTMVFNPSMPYPVWNQDMLHVVPLILCYQLHGKIIPQHQVDSKPLPALAPFKYCALSLE